MTDASAINSFRIPHNLLYVPRRLVFCKGYPASSTYPNM